MTKKQIQFHLPGALLSLVLAALFVLFFGECNTPLGPRIGSDNAMYLTMGTALAKGYAPYSDIFDHKGPLLFLLQMVPQVIGGGYSTLFVYLQEVLFLFASLRVLCAIARRLYVVQDWLVQLAYLAFLGPYMDGGNLTEEYAALFILAGLYIALRVFGEEDEETGKKSLILPAAAMGACAMLAFMTRANNALGLCGLVAGLALALAINRRFAQLFACAGGFLLGCAAAGLPVGLWLMAHGALWDAFYGSILHNMMYAETAGASRVHTLLFTPYGHGAMILAAFACAGALCAYLRTKKIALPLGMVFAAGLAGMSCFISHKFYSHYLMVLSPLAAFGAAQMLAALPRVCCCGKKRRLITAAAALCALVLVVSGYRANANRLHELEIQGSFEQDAKELFALVPEEDRDHFLAYRVEPKWYVYADALPCMRFYFLQEILADADPAVMDEIVSAFETDPPRWLVLYYNRPFSPPYDARVAAIFESRYEFVEAKGQYQLLRLKDTEIKAESNAGNEAADE